MQHKETGNYFTVTGSHCSCYGFEGQFDLEEAPIEYLKSDQFYMGCGGYDDDADDHQNKVKEYLRQL